MSATERFHLLGNIRVLSKFPALLDFDISCIQLIFLCDGAQEERSGSNQKQVTKLLQNKPPTLPHTSDRFLITWRRRITGAH